MPNRNLIEEHFRQLVMLAFYWLIDESYNRLKRYVEYIIQPVVTAVNAIGEEQASRSRQIVFVAWR